MAQDFEKRGPIEKGPKGWPINLLGVFILAIFGLMALFLIIKPLLLQKVSTPPFKQENASGGNLVKPQAGEIIKGNKLTIELVVDEVSKVAKVEFWIKTYADGKWQMIGEVTSSPFVFDWEIPETFRNKAIAITSHIYTKDGKVIRDPGGWREGIIILSQ